MSLINVNAIEPSTGTDITLGASGDTITVPSGATFTQSGTMNASAITAGTMATARLGSGTADATTFLRGDQTYAAPGGGITAASQWRLTSDLTGDADPVSANLEAVDTDPQGALGSAMTVSSGVFTFPSTGFWWVKCAVQLMSDNSADEVSIQIQGTTDNGTDGWPDQAAAFSDANASSKQTSAVDSIIDVTNTSNVKVRFKISQSDNSNKAAGHTFQNETWFTFIRLGDT